MADMACNGNCAPLVAVKAPHAGGGRHKESALKHLKMPVPRRFLSEGHCAASIEKEVVPELLMPVDAKIIDAAPVVLNSKTRKVKLHFMSKDADPTKGTLVE
jgi:hypothetical protein